MSETPQKASVSWGSNCFRICSIAILKDKRTQKSLVVANTHLDNSNGEIRLKQARVILNKIKQYNLPTLLMGDMNSGIYSNTISEIKTQMTDMGAGYDDENAVTFNNLDKNYKKSGIKIDWIFQSKDSFAVNKYAVITKNFDGKIPSDHFPIYAEFIQN